MRKRKTKPKLNSRSKFSKSFLGLRVTKEHKIKLSAENAKLFWEALQAPVTLTDAQKKLGRMMRGED